MEANNTTLNNSEHVLFSNTYLINVFIRPCCNHKTIGKENLQPNYTLYMYLSDASMDGAPLGPKTHYRDCLIKDNLGRYCMKTFDMAKEMKEW